jgi:UDP-N-acetylmuramyl tripeptide synthase
VDSIPITLGGAATHNVDNALGVTGLALAMGLPIEAVGSGLQALRPEQNPGRCNLFNIGGARVIVDFAHNPHGLQAFLELGRNLSAERRLLIIGQAGDRSDDDIRSLVEVAARAKPDRVLIKRMARYSRGRPDGEVARLIRETFLAAGTPPDKLVDEEDELEAVRDALRWAQPGDLVIALIHEDRNAVLDFLTEQAGDG